jgi:hypothetical protein
MTARSLCRRAFTLVEMLIGMALTLILVYAIAEFYAYLGDSVKDGRAMIELSSSLRGGTQRLKADLAMLTSTVQPWNDDGNASGYFEIVEGAASDIDIDGDGDADLDDDGISDLAEAASTGPTNLMGDGDDILAFTIRSAGEPLTGRYLGGTLASDTAEVIWFPAYAETNGTAGWQPEESRSLYRRQLLVIPTLGQLDPNNYSTFAAARTAIFNYWQTSDISARIRPGVDSSGNPVFHIVANSLADLTRRENRFGRYSLNTVRSDNVFPFPIQINPRDSGTCSSGSASYLLQGLSLGEDLVQRNLLAFDVRVYDPEAPLYPDDATSANARVMLQPGDFYWQTAAANAASSSSGPGGLGAYVDLFYRRYGNPASTPTALFDSWPASKSLFGTGLPAAAPLLAHDTRGVYDTWPLSYERDGINQDYTADGVGNQNLAPFDEGTDGLDTDGVNGVDDPGERETSPPYPHPLRGIQVRIRVHEPSSRQMRQATVGHDFIPE